MFSSRKAKALLIALANCDLIFVVAVIWKPDPTVTGAMITATMTLAAMYIGAQGATDAIAAYKPNGVVNNVSTPPA